MCLYDPIFKVSSVLHCVPLVRCNCQAKLKWKQVSDAAKHRKTNDLFSAFSFLVLILYLTLASVMYQIMITWSVQYFLCCTSRFLLSAAVVLIISSREQDKTPKHVHMSRDDVLTEPLSRSLFCLPPAGFCEACTKQRINK